nr:MAG TPA: hypothetical protein [Crassvirales sp.]
MVNIASAGIDIFGSVSTEFLIRVVNLTNKA